MRNPSWRLRHYPYTLYEDDVQGAQGGLGMRAQLKPSRGAAPAFPTDMRALFALFDHSEETQFWIKDREGKYRWINRGFLVNYSMECPEQVLGKTDFELSPLYIAHAVVNCLRLL